jgi:hypothetical protein
VLRRNHLHGTVKLTQQQTTNRGSLFVVNDLSSFSLTARFDFHSQSFLNDALVWACHELFLQETKRMGTRCSPVTTDMLVITGEFANNLLEVKEKIEGFLIDGQVFVTRHKPPP